LLRCMSPQLALTDGSIKRKYCERHQFDAPDPSATSLADYCCNAQSSFC
jgi:hypothetical protein